VVILSCIVNQRSADGAFMSEKALDPEFLAQYEREADWAEAHGICQRTAARYRAQGLPFLTFGGFVWIPKREGREWIASRVKRRNPRRRRKTIASPAEISAA
jgi:hypothetical protein